MTCCERFSDPIILWRRAIPYGSVDSLLQAVAGYPQSVKSLLDGPFCAGSLPVQQISGISLLSILSFRQKVESPGLSEQSLQRRSHLPFGESRGATCGTLNGKPILGAFFGAMRDVVGDRPV